MTDEKTTPTPAKKRGRPPKVATTPQESPVAESKSPEGTQVPAEPEIDVQSPTQGLPTITVEELIEGMDTALVLRVQAALARHMIKDHRMTWGEVRISLGYGLAGQSAKDDSEGDEILWRAQ